ncbi:MAG: hypothetical protein V9F01_02840, partial [Chitinophagaceae bacterium]
RRLRELITYFRSQMDPQGLVHALQATAETFFDRTGVAMEFVNRTADCCVAPEREVEVFHIVQEALANVGQSRRGEARHASIAGSAPARGISQVSRRGRRRRFRRCRRRRGGRRRRALRPVHHARARPAALGGAPRRSDSRAGRGNAASGFDFPAVDFQDGGRE